MTGDDATSGTARIRALLDSNAVDVIAAPPERYEAIQAAVAAGSVELLWTHITIDELSAIPDAEKRARLLTIAAGVCHFVLTGITVWDYSRWNFARYGPDDPEAYEAFRVGNLKHTRDVILAATAQYEDCPLVTFDGPLSGRARTRGIEVWTPDELAARIGAP